MGYLIANEMYPKQIALHSQAYIYMQFVPFAVVALQSVEYDQRFPYDLPGTI